MIVRTLYSVLLSHLTTEWSFNYSKPYYGKCIKKCI